MTVFAVWRRRGRALPEPLASRVKCLLEPASGSFVEGVWGLIKTCPPACLKREGSTAIAWAAANGAEAPPPGHPTVRLENDTLTVAAGPFPQYALYYSRSKDGDFVLVSSSLERLARLRPEGALRAQRLLSYILWTAADPEADATVYAEILRLRPCQTLVLGPDVRSRRDVPRLGVTYRKAKPEDLAVELREHLDAAVARAITPARSVGVLASGGLDSSGVLATAAAQCSRTTKALTALAVRFSGPGDDRPYLDELSSALNLIPVSLSAEDVGRWFLRSLCVDGQPAAVSTMSFDLALCSACTDRRLDVVLTGGSGDVICGGPIAFAQLARRGHVVSALHRAVKMRVPWPTTAWGRMRSFVLSPLLPRRLVRRRRRKLYRAAWIPGGFQALLDRSREASEVSLAEVPDSPDAWVARLCNGSGMSDVAEGATQQLALTGCAPVDIFLDADFVRFVLELDPLVLSHGHEYRGLYRLAMKGLLPERVRRRQDKAWFEPVIGQAALCANAIELLSDLGSMNTTATWGLVDSERVRPMFDLWLDAVRRGERRERHPGDEQWGQVWQLLSVEAFLREYGRGRALV